MPRRDASLDALLDLDGQIFVVDPVARHWVKFVVRRVPVSAGKPHGLDYSLTLHDASGKRLVGYDNAHPVSSGRGGAAGGFLARRRCRAEGERHHPMKTLPMKTLPMKTLKVGIASYEDMKARTMAIAKGELRPGRDEPKVWFSSAESFGKILSNKNRALLSTIAHARPGSLGELEALTGRKKSNLSRTLKTLESFDLVRLKRGERGRLIPEVPYDEISLVVPLVSHPGKEPKAA